MMADGDERWLIDGNCQACRRFRYCSKPCKAQKERKKAILAMMAQSACEKMRKKNDSQ